MQVEAIYKDQIKLGLEKFRLEDYDMAINALSHAVKLSPNSFLANFNLGRVNAKIKNWEMARLYFRKALIINSKAVDSWLTNNTSCIDIEDFEDPSYCLNEALSSETSDLTLRNMIGDLFYEIREDAPAQHCFDEVIMIDSENINAKKGLELLKQRNCNMTSH